MQMVLMDSHPPCTLINSGVLQYNLLDNEHIDIVYKFNLEASELGK
jgi:hypothetical protein